MPETPYLITSITETLRRLKTPIAPATINDIYAYSTVCKLWDKCTEETRDILKSSSVKSLVEYQGGDDYHIENSLIEELLSWYLQYNRTNYNFAYFVGMLKQIAETSFEQYVELELQKINEGHEARQKSDTESLASSIKEFYMIRVLVQAFDEGKQYDVGDFSFRYCDASMLSDHWAAVQQLGLQDFFSRDVDNYMFNTAPELKTFGDVVDPKYGHSGASFAFMCREMQSIAQKGWTRYVNATFDHYRQIVSYGDFIANIIV